MQSLIKKDELIKKLVNHMLQPEVMKPYFLGLSDGEMDAFEKAAKNPGTWVSGDEILLEKLYEAGYVGMLESGDYVIPVDVAEAYNGFKSKEFTKQRRKISYLYACLNTVGALYGIAPMETFAELLKRNSQVPMTWQEVKDNIRNMPPEYCDYILQDDLIYHSALYLDDRGLRRAQGNKKYYIPTLKEINDLGSMGYLPDCAELKRLEKYLRDQTGVSAEHAKYVGMQIQICIRCECEMQDIFNILTENGVILPDEKSVNGLVVCINDLWNNTRMLLNRGFTPLELSKGQNPKPVQMKDENKIIDFRSAKKNKIYPNDPCPCGSGKKYKHCCGRKNKC